MEVCFATTAGAEVIMDTDKYEGAEDFALCALAKVQDYPGERFTIEVETFPFTDYQGQPVKVTLRNAVEVWQLVELQEELDPDTFQAFCTVLEIEKHCRPDSPLADLLAGFQDGL